MKYLLWLGVVLPYLGFAQSNLVVDKSRLEYDEKSISSRQTGFALSENGRYAAFIFEDLKIKIFDIQLNKVVKKMQSPVEDIFDIKLNKKGNNLILIGKKIIYVLDWRKEKKIIDWPLEFDITRTAYRPSIDFLAVGTEGGHVMLYNLNSFKIAFSTDNKGKHVSILDISPDGQKIITGTIKGSTYPLKTFDVKTGKLLATSKEQIFTSACFDGSGRFIVAAGVKRNKAGA